jgi:hypothetical protein
MINNKTTVAELLKANETLDLLFELITPANTYKAKELISQPFQNVMNIIKLLQEGEVLKAVSIASKNKKKTLLKLNSNDFLQFLKWLIEQSKIINNLFNSLSIDDFDEDSMMLQASGVERLNKYNEIMIYYNIEKNPTAWDSIGKMPFSTIFTKLSIDKDTSQIQKNYNNLIKSKNK